MKNINGGDAGGGGKPMGFVLFIGGGNDPIGTDAEPEPKPGKDK